MSDEDGSHSSDPESSERSHLETTTGEGGAQPPSATTMGVNKETTACPPPTDGEEMVAVNEGDIKQQEEPPEEKSDEVVEEQSGEDDGEEAKTTERVSMGSRATSFFGRFRRQPSSASSTKSLEDPVEKQKQQQTRSSQQQADLATLLAQNKEYLQPSRSSVKVVKSESTSKLGLSIAQCADETHNIIVTKIRPDGLLAKVTPSPVKVGDVLISINEFECTGKSSEEVKKHLVEVMGDIVLVVEHKGGNPMLVSSTVLKPSIESQVGLEFSQLREDLPDGKVQIQLNVGNVAEESLFSKSLLQQGDIVLFINDTLVSSSDWDADMAGAFVQARPDTVTIVAMKSDANLSRTQRLWRSTRRAGVAVGGTIMVGVGIVFIPTLPPPFGEVLIAGGVAFLGTEFEAPKRLVRGARDSLRRAIGEGEPKQEESVKQTDHQTEPSVADSTSDNPDQSGAPQDNTNEAGESANGKGDTRSADGEPEPEENRVTMKERAKRFSRNVIIPFLDQVVGDKPQVAKATPPSDGTTGAIEQSDGAKQLENGNEGFDLALSDDSDAGPTPTIAELPECGETNKQ